MPDLDYYAAINQYPNQDGSLEQVTMLATSDPAADQNRIIHYVTDLGWTDYQLFHLHSTTGAGSEQGADGKDTFRYHSGSLAGCREPGVAYPGNPLVQADSHPVPQGPA